VLFINTEKYWNEYAEQNLMLASALNKKGHQVFIALDSKSRLRKQAWMRGLDIIPLAYVHNLNPLAISKLSRIIKDNNIEIIHIYNDKAMPLAIKAAQKLNFHALILTHHFGFPQRLNYFIRKYYVKKSFHIIVSSNFIKQVLDEQGLQFKNLYYIPEGVDLIRYKNTLPFDDFYTEFSIPPEFFLIGIQNPGSNNEDVSFLFDTFACIYQKKPNTIFVIFAEPKNRNLLEQIIKRRNLLNKVLIYDQNDKKPNILSAINIMVVPFNRIDYRCVILKAMAMAKPVIAVEHKRIDEILNHEKDGIIIPDMDSNTLSIAVLEVMNNKEKQKKLGLNAKKKITERFDINIISTKLEEVYAAILSKT
jgi:glycosyltransferase involved in cell wall biosynthesis